MTSKFIAGLILLVRDLSQLKRAAGSFCCIGSKTTQCYVNVYTVQPQGNPPYTVCLHLYLTCSSTEGTVYSVQCTVYTVHKTIWLR